MICEIRVAFSAWISSECASISVSHETVFPLPYLEWLFCQIFITERLIHPRCFTEMKLQMKQKISVKCNTSEKELKWTFWTQLLIPFATVTKVSNSPLSAKIKVRMLNEMYHALVVLQVTWYYNLKYTQLLRDLRVYYSMLRRLVACFRHSVRRDGTKEHVELKNERGLGRTEGDLHPKFPVVARLFFAPAAISLVPTNWEPGKG